MSASPDRRSFLQSSAVLGAGSLAFLDHLPSVSADDAKLDSKLVRLEPDIEPLVRILEETPRDRVLDEVGQRVKSGTSYREVLAALFLAGVRNVQPRPSVGFKFHAVLVVNSAHQSSLAGPDRERWLPIFWAIDNFKNAEAQNLKESGWRMKPVEEMKLPAAHRAREAFTEAMQNWDVEAADVAVAAYARSATSHELFDTFARFGCRDFRDIGHKAIFVANAFRCLDTIGWRYSEPVLRSLAYALLAHEGDNPAKRDGKPDQSGRRNAELARKFTAEWQNGKPSPEASGEVLAATRTASDAELSDRALSLVNGGVAPASVWDGLFCGAGELLMRQPGIVGLHTLTTLNALHFSYGTCTDDHTRKLLLLQAAAFVPQFREAMKSRGKLGEARIDALGTEGKAAPVKFESILQTLSKDKPAAARLAADYLRTNPHGARELVDAARLLIFLKGTDSHDYKFSAAVMEDHTHIAAPWRDRFLAASLFWLKGASGPDSPVVQRTRAALA